MSGSETDNEIESIAVIGMAGRFPGAKNVDEFWKNLKNGVESISFFTDEELMSAGVNPTMLRNPDYVRARAVLDDIELFDAVFFGVNPREAEVMNPQHRIFLECAWEALEHAGYCSDRYEGLIGVYAGSSMNGYLNRLYSNQEQRESFNSFQAMIGNEKDYLPTRVSYKLNLKGPSLNVQTACSTSLVAAHLACQSLLSYQSDIALAGGCSVRFPQQSGYLFQEGGINSPDGHCRAFDAAAQGTVSGNGVGIVVLKRLSEALIDGDYIHAIIKGSAINNDGSAKVGFTAPGVNGQAAVIAMAQILAGVEPDTISYIEAHGTGTALGDPIEIAALTQVFRFKTKKTGFCKIGALKSNIGHLDAAAGVAGLIKTILSLKHKQIPPSLHFEHPNPQIDFENSPFRVNDRLSEWEAAFPRRAGVSSFGIGGTNAHLILEESPEVGPSGESRQYQLLAVTAKTITALEAATADLAEHLSQSGVNLADAAYTLHVGRKAFGHRRVLVCQKTDEAIELLQSLDQSKVFTAIKEDRERPVIYLFSGQGAQYVDMGLELYQHEPEFRKEIDACFEILNGEVQFDLRDALYPKDARRSEAADLMNQTYITQPSLFAVEYALAKLWMSWGIRPKAMIGHSIGEYVAATIAGVMSVEDALKLVAARGLLMQELPPGAMLLVPASENEIAPLLDDTMSIAVINGPSLCVVSGPVSSADQLESRLAEKGIECRRLKTSHAFHSPMMEPILERFIERASRVRLSPPEIPYVSNVTGTWITDEQATDPSYWARHLRRTVRFSEGARELLRQPQAILIEVGPGRSLCGFIRQHPDKLPTHSVFSSLRSPSDKTSDQALLLNTLGKLWLGGMEVDWPQFYGGQKRRRVPLPTYPFERKRYWIEPSTSVQKKIEVDNQTSKDRSIEADASGNGARTEPFQIDPNRGLTVRQSVAVESQRIGSAAENSVHATRAQRLISSQLRIMSEQLELIRKKQPPRKQ